MSSEETAVTQDPQDERKVTWGYTRKVNLGNYESEELSVYVTDHAPKSTKNMAKWVGDKSEAMFDTLKAQVWAGLDLDHEYDEMGRPKLIAQAPAPTETIVTASVGGPAGPRPVTQRHPRANTDAPTVAQVGYYADTPDFCKKCGNREFYDNRADQDAKMQAGARIGPDWKCKSCGNGEWRPGSYDYNQGVGRGPTQTHP